MSIMMAMASDKPAEMTRQMVKKVRELRRDALWLKYGEQWMDHDDDAGQFFTGTRDNERALLAFVLAFADGDPAAIAAVKEVADRC